MLPHTPANAQLYDAVMVVVSRKLSRKLSTIHYTFRSPTAASIDLNRIYNKIYKENVTGIGVKQYGLRRPFTMLTYVTLLWRPTLKRYGI